MGALLFQGLVVSKPSAPRARWVAAASVLLHGVAVGALVLAPLLTAPDLPVILGAPLTGIVIPLVRASAGGGPPQPRQRTVAAPRSRTAVALQPADTVAPLVGSSDDAAPLGASEAVAVGDPCPECAPGRGVGENVGSVVGVAPGPAETPVVRPGGDITAPRKLRHVAPVYPELALRARASGVVILDCVIGVDGRITSVRVLRGHPLLDAAALAAVEQWTYEATRLNGAPVAVQMTVTVRFEAR